VFTKNKHDGHRLIVRKEGAAVRLFTRNGYDWSGRFPAIAGGVEGCADVGIQSVQLLLDLAGERTR
jgi:ATP-dependent DNA ligase